MADDGPDLAGIDELNESDTGFSITPIGPERVAELIELRTHYLGLYPQLQAIWNSRPFDGPDGRGAGGGWPWR